jgi:hypothetical protein
LLPAAGLRERLRHHHDEFVRQHDVRVHRQQEVCFRAVLHA